MTDFFAQDVAAGLEEMRALSESLMVDHIRVEVSDGFVLDEASFEDVESWSTVYEGKARFQRAERASSESEAGSAFAGRSLVDVRVPVDTPLLSDDARVTVLSGRHAGKVLTVKGRSFQSFERDARYACEAVEW